MTERIDLHDGDASHAFDRIVECLRGGGVVGLPGETTYFRAVVASGEDSAVQNPPDGETARTVLVSSADEVAGVIPDLPTSAERLMRRAWPGPLIVTAPHDMLSFSGPGLSQTIAGLPNEDGIRFKRTGHSVPRSVVEHLQTPLLAIHSFAESSRTVSAAELTETPGQLDLVADAGDVRYPRAATHVVVNREDWTMSQEGVYSPTSLRRLSARLILFVCTGNTCRSPMAEGLFRHMLAERLGCSDAELVDRGYMVLSAGISAGGGMPASPATLQILRDRGIDLSEHASQPLTASLLDLADHVYTMTSAHREVIMRERPDASGRVSLLSRDGESIPDPIGGGLDEYRSCERAIEQNLRLILEDVA